MLIEAVDPNYQFWVPITPKPSIFERMKITKPSFSFLISTEEETLDIVFDKPISVGRLKINELSIQFDYFWSWILENRLNIRIETTFDPIAETTTQTIRFVDKSEYLDLSYEQQKTHINKFLIDYKKQSL
jgi:hypothetical protein